MNLTHLTKHDLYLSYLKGVKNGHFEGAFNTYRELVQTGRIEVEVNFDPLTSGETK